MTGSISNDYGAVTDGVTRAAGGLPPSAGGPQAPGADPRLTAAVDDTATQNKRGRDDVQGRGEKTSRYTRDLEGIQERGSRGMRGAGDGPGSGSGSGSRGGVGGGSGQMPQMPQVPQQAAAPQPQMSAPQPQMAAPQMSTPQMPAPSGVSNIDPKVLAALVAAVQQQQAASGETPGLGRDPNRVTEGATTPQARDPLDVSQVSLDKHPGGTLSQDEVADVIDQALTINGIPNDPALRDQWQELYQHMAKHESGNNPNSVNNWDSNATGAMMEDGGRANSSRGIWQCIPSTFAAYHMGGTSTSIYDPLASAAASINYVMETYNVSADGAGLAGFMSRQGVGGGGYQGY